MNEFLKAVSAILERAEKKDKRYMEKLAEGYGISDKTHVKELIELAIVKRARALAHQDKSTYDRFLDIVQLYENQTNLSHRTSKSILLQQYSTPAPIGYLAGVFCGIENFTLANKKIGFEPSAGNGLLTIAGHPQTFIVNELDTLRHAHLLEQNYKAVYKVDATQDFSKSIASDYLKKMDAVITNPPFGYVGKGFYIDTYSIVSLEQIMALRALDTLKDNGRAAIIIGWLTPFDKVGRVARGAHRVFLNYLCSRYHVLDIIPIDGHKLYSRQGTAFDTRLILINGRKQTVEGSAPLKDATRDNPVKEFTTLFNRVMEAKEKAEMQIQNIPTPQPTSINKAMITPHYFNLENANKQFKKFNYYKLTNPNAFILQENKTTYESFSSDATVIADALHLPLHIVNVENTTQQYVTFSKDYLEYYLDKLVKKGLRIAIVDVLNATKTNSANALTTTPPNPSTNELESELLQQMQALELEQSEFLLNQTKNSISDIQTDNYLGAPYIPASDSCVVLNTIVPDSMDYETKQALSFIESQIGGSVDNFVMDRLNYPSHVELCKALSAEQTDAVAMAIYNIEAREQGMIIGDQTGIGKGRIAAAMIRYAVMRNLVPIFITEKPNLFSDLYRDLSAIGSGNLIPFIINERESKTDIKDDNGTILHQALPTKELQSFIKNKHIPAYCHSVLATYSQLNSPKNKPEKPDFILKMAQGSLVIMDESHNASGSSNVGEFLQEVLRNTIGVTYLSATFAKQPSNMPIYAMKTAIRDANMSKESLVDAIYSGGVALQEIIASQLVKEGQMLRRERSFEGVEVNYISLDDLGTEHSAISDNLTEIIRQIIDFQSRVVNPRIEKLDKAAAFIGKEITERGGTSKAGIDNLPYFSKVFQVIHQMLFAIKAEAVADRAIMRLKEGKKPVIAFASTMGSFIENMTNPDGSQVGDGDVINTDFSTVLLRGLEGTLRYSERGHNGDRENRVFDIHEFDKAEQAHYYQIEKSIKELHSGICISPIDIIVQKLKKAGYKVAEVTGRKYEIQLNSKANSGLISTREKINTNDAFRQFNDNEIDVLLINQSGSTGASAHAIITKKVPASGVKQRVMLVLQAELDINTEVQKRGRINRTGQILLPIYDYIMSSIPAEKRLMMMLQKKLKSLDANTTSNQKQSTKILDVPDFLNKYGDKVVTQYLVENPEVNTLLGDPIGVGGIKDVEMPGVEYAAHRVSGRVAVLSSKMQAEFYNDVSNAYNDYIEQLKQSGEYDLEVETMNLEAKTLDKYQFIIGTGGDSVFGTDSVIEKVEVNVLKKPFSRSELANLLRDNLKGEDPHRIQANIISKYNNYFKSYLEREKKGIVERYEKMYNAVEVSKEALKYKRDGNEQGFIEYVKEQKEILKESEAQALNFFIKNSQNKKNILDTFFRFFYIGRYINFPFQNSTEGLINIPAVFLGFAIDYEKDNAFIPSKIKLRFALSNSNKYITLPASNKDILAIHSASLKLKEFPITETHTKLLDTWEQDIKASSVNRNIRYIITGNILQAFNKLKGKLISYSTFDGHTKKGILLSELLDVQTIAKQIVEVPVSLAHSVFSSLVKGKSITTNQSTSLINIGDTYQIIVYASKAKGGDIFLDEDILKLVRNNNFEKSADKMKAELPHEHLKDFLDILTEKFKDTIEVSYSDYEKMRKENPITVKPRNKIQLLTTEQKHERLQMQLLAQSLELEQEQELFLRQL
jgi:predicted RNA methylase